MAYRRIDSTERINNPIGGSSRIVHTTGNFTLYWNANSSTHSISSSTGTTFTLASSVGTVVLGHYTVLKNGTDITDTVTQSGTGNRTFTFATALVSTDNVEIDYFNTNDLYAHTGAENLCLTLNTGDFVAPQSSEVSIETLAAVQDSGSTLIHRVY